MSFMDKINDNNINKNYETIKDKYNIANKI